MCYVLFDPHHLSAVTGTPFHPRYKKSRDLQYLTNIPKTLYNFSILVTIAKSYWEWLFTPLFWPSVPDIVNITDEMRQRALYEIDALLQQSGKSLTTHPHLPPAPRNNIKIKAQKM